MRNSAKYLLATAGIYLLTAGHPAADSIPVQILDPNLQVTTVALNAAITQPIGIVFLGTNDFLVLEKASGQVKRVINGVVQAPPVLDLAVNSNSERGLLSLVLHPNFPATPWVYVRWTESSTGADTGGRAATCRCSATAWTASSGTASTLTLDRHIITLRALQTDNSRRRRPSRAPTTPTRTATTTAA